MITASKYYLSIKEVMYLHKDFENFLFSEKSIKPKFQANTYLHFSLWIFLYDLSCCFSYITFQSKVYCCKASGQVELFIRSQNNFDYSRNSESYSDIKLLILNCLNFSGTYKSILE